MLSKAQGFLVKLWPQGLYIVFHTGELNLICILKPFTLFLSTRKNVSIYKIYLRVCVNVGSRGCHVRVLLLVGL